MDQPQTDEVLDILSLAERAAPTVKPGMGYEEAREILMAGASQTWCVISTLARFRMRERYVRNYGFSMLTLEEIDALAGMLKGQKVVEVAAGSGYLSAELSARGVDALASDDGGWKNYMGRDGAVHQRDHEGDSLSVLGEHVGAVVMVWPPISDPFAGHVANAMTSGQVLYYEGEGRGGCTADDGFFQEVLDESRWEVLEEPSHELNKRHLRFESMRDSWWVFKKR